MARHDKRIHMARFRCSAINLSPGLQAPQLSDRALDEFKRERLHEPLMVPPRPRQMKECGTNWSERFVSFVVAIFVALSSSAPPVRNLRPSLNFHPVRANAAGELSF